jgi:hypothetical protein
MPCSVDARVWPRRTSVWRTAKSEPPAKAADGLRISWSALLEKRLARKATWRAILGALLTVLLDTRRAQAGEAVLVDGVLPGEEFLDGQRITAARLFERQ